MSVKKLPLKITNTTKTFTHFFDNCFVLIFMISLVLYTITETSYV